MLVLVVDFYQRLLTAKNFKICTQILKSTTPPLTQIMCYVRGFLKLENVIGVKNANPLSKVIGSVSLRMEQKIGLYVWNAT
jgi:hypothetical protein